MRVKGIVLFLLCFAMATAQDKIYFLDGSSKECKVTSINPDYINISTNGYEESISKLSVLLIEFKNGTVEVINEPQENHLYSPGIANSALQDLPTTIYKHNYVSVNTLALFNSDIAAFYEYQLRKIPIGFELMGAYNFNLYSSVQNNYIKPLPNSKKNFDVGAGIKFYVSSPEDKLKIFFGVLVKYTEFSYNKTIIDTLPVPPGPFGYYTNTTMKPTVGNQLATLLTLGGETFISDQVFAGAMCGLGAFKVKGDYRYEYNLHTDNSLGKINYLPKIYLAVKLGYNF